MGRATVNVSIDKLARLEKAEAELELCRAHEENLVGVLEEMKAERDRLREQLDTLGKQTYKVQMRYREALDKTHLILDEFQCSVDDKDDPYIHDLCKRARDALAGTGEEESHCIEAPSEWWAQTLCKHCSKYHRHGGPCDG